MTCLDDDEAHQKVAYYFEVKGLAGVGRALVHLSEKTWVDRDQVLDTLWPWMNEYPAPGN